MVPRAQDLGLMTGFIASPNSEEILITHYDDDTLVMIEAKSESIENLREIFLWFETFAGLSMNVHKTKLYKVKECDDFVEQVADWGCVWGIFPSTYP